MIRSLYILILLSIYYNGNSQCDARISLIQSGTVFQFTDISTTDSDDEVISRIWKFGDGNTNTQSTAAHQYITPGNYQASLNITTANACQDKDSVLIEVCDLGLDFTLGTVCNDEGLVDLVLSIDDVFNTLPFVRVFLDEVEVSDTLIPIPNGDLNLNLKVAGDGTQHVVRVESGLTGFCSELISFTTQNCLANCFIGNLVIDDTRGEVHEIAVLDSQYAPMNRLIDLGDKVRYTWFSDGHSSTSIDTVSPDQWNSEVQDSGFIFEIDLKFPGLKKYYSIPDDSAYFGNIVANCPTTLGNVINLTFNNNALPPEGFYLTLDGIVLTDSIYSYHISGITSVDFFLGGDGKSHQIGIVDIEDPSCTLNGVVKAINCNGSQECAVNIQAFQTGRCDEDSLVTVELTVSTLSDNQEQVYLFLNDTTIIDTVIIENNQNTLAIQLPGDGLLHKFTAIDASDSLCQSEIEILLDDCSAPCEIQNLEIGTGSNNTIVIGIQNNMISLQDLIMASGDDVLWQWVQDVPVGIRSIANSGPDSWDSGIQGKDEIYISPVLNPGLHPYELYNEDTIVIFNASIEVIAACDENQIPVFYQFNDINGDPGGFDIYLDSVRLPSGPFPYALDGNNRGTFQLEGDDEIHDIEIRDLGEEECSATGLFVAPICEVTPCGGTINVQVQDTCYNDDTTPYLINISHPNPDDAGYVFRINGQLYNDQSYFYDEDGNGQFILFLEGDSTFYEFTYMDILDDECRDTVLFQSPLCETDCHLSEISTNVITELYADLHPEIPDSIVGCQDSFIYVEVVFSERYNDSNGYRVAVDGELVDSTIYPYVTGDGMNTAFIKVIGNMGFHTVEIIDALDENCTFFSSVTTPICYSPCNIEIASIEQDSCISEEGFYQVILDSLTNSIGYQVFYDGDSLEFTFDSLLTFIGDADGLSHSIKIIDNAEPLCLDSIEFIAAYCLECPILLSLNQLDSCVVGDSIGYEVIFNPQIDTFDVAINFLDSVFVFNPADHDFKFTTRVQGDSSSYIFIVSSLEDQFCHDTIVIQTIDCTPIICEAGFEFSIDGLTITFNDTSVTSEPIIDQSWTINEVINIGNLSTFNYTVDSIGMYSVCHSIQTDSCEDVSCLDILVGDPCTLVEPFFTVTQINDGFQFTNMSVGNIDEYLYRFGDGIFSNSTDPFHIYDTSGVFEACLIVRQNEFDCEKEYCEEINVIIDNVTENLFEDILVYPNPLTVNSNEIFINHPGNSIKNYKIIDIHGRLIKSGSVEYLSRDLSKIRIEESVSEGIYYIQISIDDYQATKRIAIIR